MKMRSACADRRVRWAAESGPAMRRCTTAPCRSPHRHFELPSCMHSDIVLGATRAWQLPASPERAHVSSSPCFTRSASKRAAAVASSPPATATASAVSLHTTPTRRSYKARRRDCLSQCRPHPFLLVLVTSAFSAIRNSTIAARLFDAATWTAVFLPTYHTLGMQAVPHSLVRHKLPGEASVRCAVNSTGQW
jgi:hypothetical protein